MHGIKSLRILYLARYSDIPGGYYLLWVIIIVFGLHQNN